MFTTGSKFYFGVAVAALVAALVYWVDTNLEFLGTTILFSVAVVAAFLGAVVIAFRDANVRAPALEATSAADAEGIGRGARVSPSMWPIVGAFGAGLVVIGLVYDRRWFVGGILVLVATTIEWAVQAWSDRASDDPEYNHRIRGRIMHPLEFPILGALAVGLVIFGFSRVMLAIPKSAAVGVFIGIGALVLVVGAILSTPRRVPGAVVAIVLVAGGVAVLAGGIAAATSGERTALGHHVEETGPDKPTSNSVGAKASVGATIVATTGGSLPDLTLPRSASINLLFENQTPEPRQLLIEAGSEPKLDAKGQEVKDASGNVIMQPITFHTDFIGQGKSQVLTVTMPLPGAYDYRAQIGDTTENALTGKVLVP